DHVLGADVGEDLGLFGAAHDVDQIDPVLEADLDQHLAQVRGRGGVDQGGVVLQPHALDHGKRGQRIDEAGRAVGGAGVRRQGQGGGGGDDAVLGVHGPTQDGDL